MRESASRSKKDDRAQLWKLSAALVVSLTKSNFFVESNTGAGLLSLELLGGEEHALLFLESLFCLNISHLG